MRANGAKRKIFNDAVNLLAGIVEEALAAWFGKGGEADVLGGRDREAG